MSLKYFSQVLSVISEFNVSEEDCLSSAGLSEFPTSERVKVDHLAYILNTSATGLNEPQLGIKCGLKYPILQFTRPAEILKLCDNLTHAADIYNKYCPLFHTVGTPSGIVSEDERDRMIWIPNFDANLTDDYRQFIELILTNLLTSINWLAWKVPHAVECINIKHEAVLPIDSYEDLFECDVKFGQAEYSLILKDGVKDEPFSMSDQAELAKVCVKFDMAMNELFQYENLIDRIELQIRRSIGHVNPTKSSVAIALNLSERTMARDLKNKETCFKDIKTRILQDLAVTKINQGLPLVEIAHALGYNDQPAFTRAYKKWFGYPPGKQNTPKC